VSEPTWRLLGQRVRSLIYLTVILTVASSTAQALNPARAITQYVHTVWNRDQGVPAGIYDMAQDHNGFIWLASRNGLFRFDGQTFERVDSATSSQQKLIFTLTATRDGSMWIGYERGGLAVYRNGSIKNVPDAGDGSPIIRIVQTRDGTMWAAAGGSRDMPLLRQSNGKFIPVNASWGLPKDQSIDLISASDGSLWMSTFVHPTIFRLAPGSHRFERINVPVRGRAAISEDPEGRVWVSDELGTRMVWKDGHVRSGSRFYPTPSFDRGAYATWDLDGSMWGSRSSKGGIFRLTNPFRNKQADYETSPGAKTLRL
jgi:streptogramin lyase